MIEPLIHHPPPTIHIPNVSHAPTTRQPFAAELTVEPYLHGVRIDSFLVRHFRNYTPFRMQRIVRAGGVQIDGGACPLERRVVRGESVSVRLLEPPDKLIDPEPLPLEVLYEDAWLIAVNKPAGMVAHPVGGFQSGTLANGLQHHLDRQTPLPGLLRPGVVHRLDRETSGVIVAAKEHLSHRGLSVQFQQNEPCKRYLAIVEGVVRDDRGRIDLPIGTLAERPSILMSCEPAARNRKRATTEFHILERYAAHSLIEATPLTGRIHQIRVHLAAIGHPVVGDEFYGPRGCIRDPDAQRRESNVAMSRHALHAASLRIVHPVLGESVGFSARPPSDMLDAIDRLASATNAIPQERPVAVG